MTRSLFSAVEMAPRDPILGLTEAFNTDSRPEKVNLGVGIYHDERGRIPLLDAVRRAERDRLEAAPARGYLPIEGFSGYNQAVRELVFGKDAPLLAARRVATFEALGGTGALRIGADFLRRLAPGAGVWISQPSWENHRALFEAAGFEVRDYPYYDPQTHGLRFDEMLSSLRSLPSGSIVILHACCHNPTGVDPDERQWDAIVDAVRDAGLTAFLDLAYQGFATGIAEDALAVRKFADSGLSFLVSSSFSKSFSLYGERVGALSIVTASSDETARVTSQVKRVIRTNYSNPPTHGGAIVASVLTTPELRASWERELTGMRERIRAMRSGLVERLHAQGVEQDFSFVERQRGMFSYSGLNPGQVEQLRERFGIYAVATGRICLAALNDGNLDTVARAIAEVLRR